MVATQSSTKNKDRRSFTSSSKDQVIYVYSKIPFKARTRIASRKRQAKKKCLRLYHIERYRPSDQSGQVTLLNNLGIEFGTPPKKKKNPMFQK